MGMINVEEVMGRVMNNKKLFLRLLGSFKGRKMAEDIKTAVENGNFEEIKKAAHALRGVSLNLGMNALADIAANIENKAANQENAADDLPALFDCIDELEKEIATLTA